MDKGFAAFPFDHRHLVFCIRRDPAQRTSCLWKVEMWVKRSTRWDLVLILRLKVPDLSFGELALVCTVLPPLFALETENPSGSI